MTRMREKSRKTLNMHKHTYNMVYSDVKQKAPKDQMKQKKKVAKYNQETFVDRVLREQREGIVSKNLYGEDAGKFDKPNNGQLSFE